MLVFGYLILSHCSLMFFQLKKFFSYLISDSSYCCVFNLMFLLQYLIPSSMCFIYYVVVSISRSQIWYFLSMFYVSKLPVHTEQSHTVPILMSLFPNFNIYVSSGLVFVDYGRLFLYWISNDFYLVGCWTVLYCFEYS